MKQFLYVTLIRIVRFFLFFVHPVFRVEGRQNVPEGACVICCNHSNLSDPLWLLFGLWLPRMPVILAKQELMKVPLLGAFLRMLGLIGVDRENRDVHAVKACMKALRGGEKLIIFPEGTRVRPGRQVQAKTGAALLAERTDCALLPVYLTKGKKLFCPLRLVIGEPFRVEKAGAKATMEELQAATDRLMREIYAMGERA